METNKYTAPDLQLGMVVDEADFAVGWQSED